jgi:hypothetical protein
MTMTNERVLDPHLTRPRGGRTVFDCHITSTPFAELRVAFGRPRLDERLHPVLVISQGGAMRRFPTSIMHAGVVAVGCAAWTGCSAAPEQSAAPEPTGHTTQAVTGSDSWVVIPAYYWAGSDTNWDQLLNASWTARAIVIVTGPNSGPPTAPDDIALLGPRIDALHQKGAQVLGYVSFKSGRSYDAIQTDVLNWKSAYSIEGIFYDIAGRTDTGDIGKAETLWQLTDANFNYAREYQPATAVFNWGQTSLVLQPYIDCVTQAAGSGRFDVGWTNVRFVSWEGFDDHLPPPPPNYYRYMDDSAPEWSADNNWVYSYRPDMFVHIVHDFSGV